MGPNGAIDAPGYNHLCPNGGSPAHRQVPKHFMQVARLSGGEHNARVATSAFAGEDVDVLALLSAANRRRLLENARDEIYPAGARAFGAGGSNRAFLLKRGLARTYWAVSDGREATTAFIYPGNLVSARHPAREVPAPTAEDQDSGQKNAAQ